MYGRASLDRDQVCKDTTHPTLTPTHTLTLTHSPTHTHTHTFTGHTLNSIEAIYS
jgi:hypothetical protein